MAYREQFPDFDFDVPALISESDGWEDTSWHNDSCPNFTCDVFVLWIDYADRHKRELMSEPQFVMTCEGVTMLESDSWEDVRAFIEDGERHFPSYDRRAALTALFTQWGEREGLALESADEMLIGRDDLTAAQREWLNEFVRLWDAADPPRPRHT